MNELNVDREKSVFDASYNKELNHNFVDLKNQILNKSYRHGYLLISNKSDLQYIPILFGAYDTYLIKMVLLLFFLTIT